MGQVIRGNASAITVSRNERDAIRKFHCDVLGGRIANEDKEKDICRLAEEFYIVFRYGDDRDESEFLRSPKALWFQIKTGDVEEMTRRVPDFGATKITRPGPNAAREEKVERRKDKARSDLASMHPQNQTN
jgi:hypothetical protein